MIYLDSDNLVSLSGLYNNGFINDAMVSGQLIDVRTGTVLHSYTLTYLDGTDGNYSGLIPESVANDLVEDQEVRHEITVASGDYQLFVVELDVAGHKTLD